MRGAPQVGFSATIRKIRARTSLATPLRPPTRLNLEIHIQYKRNPAPCQFTTVRGVTKTRGFLHPDQNVLNATQNSLCRAVNRVRGRCACKASSCRRRAKFSRARSSRERKELTIHPRKCRSDTIMTRIISELSEFSFFAKSFILQVYEVLARHRSTYASYCTPVIIGFGVHAGTVDGVTLCRMFNRAIRGQRRMPNFLSSDNDPLCRFHQWQANLRILDVTEIKSVPYVPLSHPFVERLIGTVRREYLDHILFWTAADLENKLLDFRTYFNNHRTHTSMEGRTPDLPASRPIANLRSFRWQPHCRSLYQTPVAA